ncbi:MAG: abortive infection family protein [Candidatus Pacearchaeota archaeon]
MNKITEVTRRNIFDVITIERISWNGSLEEPDFLSRIFDLSSMPSFDGRFNDFTGDIWQHRINNLDWDDNWIFTDSRLDLIKCDDAIFLQFLCEMLHPVVRRDKTEVTKLVQLFNEYLAFDGYELVEKAQISGHSIFAGRQKLITNQTVQNRKAELVNVLTEDYIVRQITVMESSIENAPHLAIGTSKELIESICKTILNELEVTIDDNFDLPRLLKETSKELKLTPRDIPNEAKASETIKKILGSLSMVVQGISELRNSYGTGHGKDAKFKGLNARHARLAVGASSTLAVFLLETHKLHQEINENK